MSYLRTRWAAIGAAVAVTLGAGGIGITHATLGSGERTSFVPITPCRLVDTRPAPFNRGPRIGPLGAAATFTITATAGTVGDCTITPSATGLVLNVTAVNQTQPTFLTIYPTGSIRPETSNLNPSPGQPATPNAVTVDLNGSGQFDIYNLQGSLDVIVDVVGYYEDHHHDDRYYTKAEIDALNAASPAPWQTVPSGTTVIGPIRWDEQSPAAGGDYRLFIPFPAVAPAEPSAANWAPDASADTTDDDATCTGTAANPTAPAGKVCLYRVNSANATSMTGEVSVGYLRHGFEIWWSPAASGDMFVYGAWAYTAP